LLPCNFLSAPIAGLYDENTESIDILREKVSCLCSFGLGAASIQGFSVVASPPRRCKLSSGVYHHCTKLPL